MTASRSDARYRADVDGLRAIAVLAVVGYHVSPARVSGGFVGVDVFFVISGYLITGILLRDQDDGRASLARFYGRRVRRIFPALVTVLLAVLAAAWLLLFSFEFTEFGKQLAAGTAFLSNVSFYREAGYFDLDAELKPLLHLWSLGIEEQFYLTWPLLLWFANRRGRALPLTAAAVAVSLGLSLALTPAHPSASFYLPHTRAWELLSGALLALLERRARARSGPGEEPRLLRFPETAAVLGLASVGLAVFWIKPGQPYPGWRSLLPCVGTWLLIAAGPHARVNRRLLALRALVFVGLISYPLYLWHWPLLYFARISVVGSPGHVLRLAAVAAAALLAWLTYRVVETPVRASRRRATIPVLGGLAAGICVLGLVAWSGRGLVPRLASRSREYADFVPWSGETFHSPECAKAFSFPTFYCSAFPVGARPSTVLVGDSHAHHLSLGLGQAVERRGASMVTLGENGCAPFIGSAKADEACRAVIAPALEFAAADPAVNTVFLAAAWEYRLHALGEGPFRERLDATLAALTRAGRRVVFVHDTPDIGFNPRSCFNGDRLRPAPPARSCGVPLTRVASEQAGYRAIVRAVLDKYPQVATLDLVGPPFCDETFCYAVRAGTILYRDKDHLSVTGSLALADAFQAALGGSTPQASSSDLVRYTSPGQRTANLIPLRRP
jgi:peptidoglycan/LPS O-acetylase OafA/YrhL